MPLLIDPSSPMRLSSHVTQQQKETYYGLAIPVVDSAVLAGRVPATKGLMYRFG
jgi:hypothetical protein